MNGPLRQYFPKETDLCEHHTSELQAVPLALNTRPREALDWEMPAEVFDALLILDLISHDPQPRVATAVQASA